VTFAGDNSYSKLLDVEYFEIYRPHVLRTKLYQKDMKSRPS